MRIAYVVEWNPYKSSGVINKINSQCREWTEMGHEVRVFLTATCSGDDPVYFYSPTDIFKLVYSFVPSGGMYTYAAKLSNFIRIRRAVSFFSPDVVYYRQGVWYPGLLSILKSGRSFFVEINTDDVSEASRFNFIKRFLHINTRSFALAEADGLIAVTAEIRRSLLKINENIAVIANSHASPKILPKNYHCRPSLRFIGSPIDAAHDDFSSHWHGVDKFVEMARGLPSFDFHLVGCSIDHDLDNMHSHGELYGDDLRRLIASVHVGVGTLALHRKNMNEACPLKVREYLANRLPIIIAYDDTDIIFDHSWVLRIENCENSISNSIKKIFNFVEMWKFREAPEEAEVIVSPRSKEAARLRFFESAFRKD